MKPIVFVFLCLITINEVLAETIDASANNGTLGFVGEHAGMVFTGTFTRWQAELVLPPAVNPKISAEFELNSATTGDSVYDSTLPEGDWFDVENFPTATFESESIVLGTDDKFEVIGNLQLRGKSLPVEFILHRKDGKLTAEFDIDRLAYEIGAESDPDAEWVSQYINMRLTISTST